MKERSLTVRLGTIHGTLCSFVSLKYFIRKVQENHGRWKLNGTLQVWVFADVSLLKATTDTLLQTYIEVNLGVNSEKTNES
jgi:hypothetical protein